MLARAYPISIDAERLHELAANRRGCGARRRDPSRSRRPARDVPRRGPPRLHERDYWSGFKPSARLIAEGRIDPDEAVLLQLAIPSRERVDLYRQLRDDIDRLVGRINGEIATHRPPTDHLPARVVSDA